MTLSVAAQQVEEWVGSCCLGDLPRKWGHEHSNREEGKLLPGTFFFGGGGVQDGKGTSAKGHIDDERPQGDTKATPGKESSEMDGTKPYRQVCFVPWVTWVQGFLGHKSPEVTCTPWNLKSPHYRAALWTFGFKREYPYLLFISSQGSQVSIQTEEPTCK